MSERSRAQRAAPGCPRQFHTAQQKEGLAEPTDSSELCRRSADRQRACRPPTWEQSPTQLKRTRPGGRTLGPRSVISCVKDPRVFAVWSFLFGFFYSWCELTNIGGVKTLSCASAGFIRRTVASAGGSVGESRVPFTCRSAWKRCGFRWQQNQNRKKKNDIFGGNVKICHSQGSIAV